jgi:hypothetical protein
MKIKTEFNFILPRGIKVEDGKEQKIRGVMRLARVNDLTDVYRDPRIGKNPSYFYVIILTRVVLSLTPSDSKIVTNRTIEQLSPENFAFLVDFFNEINHKVINMLPVKCSNCGNEYITEVTLAGEL